MLRATAASSWALAVVIAFATAAGPAFGHGFAGKRFFPATIATDDPFVADELSLPTVSRRETAASEGEPAATETATSMELSKRITPNLGLGFEATHLSLRSADGEVRKGFDNLAASIKYQFYRSDEHETIVSAGLDWDIGGSGAERVGAESFSTLTPAVFFGKGFGDLGDGMKFLRPFAVTGSLGVALPTRSSTTTVDDMDAVVVEQHPDTLNVGLALEYSLPYLQSFVKDVGLREPFNRLIPVIEFVLEKPLDRGGGPTTGTVNPGILWTGRTMQLGLEAVVPINRATGGKTGVVLQVHFFLDDLFPRSLGRPIFAQ